MNICDIVQALGDCPGSKIHTQRKTICHQFQTSQGHQKKKNTPSFFDIWLPFMTLFEKVPIYSRSQYKNLFTYSADYEQHNHIHLLPLHPMVWHTTNLKLLQKKKKKVLWLAISQRQVMFFSFCCCCHNWTGRKNHSGIMPTMMPRSWKTEVQIPSHRPLAQYLLLSYFIHL